RWSNNGRSTRATAGSDTNPRARLATVIPSWDAATESLSRSTAAIRAFAPGVFWLTSSSTRVFRTATRANSAATKNPFTATSTGMARRLRTVGVSKASPTAELLYSPDAGGPVRHRRYAGPDRRGRQGGDG